MFAPDVKPAALSPDRAMFGVFARSTWPEIHHGNVGDGDQSRADDVVLAQGETQTVRDQHGRTWQIIRFDQGRKSTAKRYAHGADDHRSSVALLDQVRAIQCGMVRRIGTERRMVDDGLAREDLAEVHRPCAVRAACFVDHVHRGGTEGPRRLPIEHSQQPFGGEETVCQPDRSRDRSSSHTTRTAVDRRSRSGARLRSTTGRASPA